MKKYLLLLLCITSYSISYAQINEEIRKKSDENRQQRTEQTERTTRTEPESETSSYDDDTDYSGDACVDGCFLAIEFVNLFVDGIVALSEQQQRIMAKDSINNRITSLQITADVGVVPNNYQIVMPRIRGNLGVFSTELRVFDLIEKRLQGDDHYATFDWQILIFNLASVKNFNLSIGTGFMQETYSSLYFNEWSATMDIYLNNNWRINLEGRTANDYETITNIRKEATGGLYIPIKTTPKLSLYGNLKGYTAMYYETVPVNSLMFGTSLTIY